MLGALHAIIARSAWRCTYRGGQAKARTARCKQGSVVGGEKMTNPSQRNTAARRRNGGRERRNGSATRRSAAAGWRVAAGSCEIYKMRRDYRGEIRDSPPNVIRGKECNTVQA